ncbi:MAG: amidohydrolase [Planctomycetes bacterium]|nr:amidohydrolase [Planctomycetota bacterium]
MQNEAVLGEARAIQDWIISLRRRIHEHPELQYEEVQTSRLVQETLAELQIPFQANVAKTGVVATIGNGNGPCVALRADMDALPIHEETDVPFRSRIDGKMHACGHDCHTSMLLGAARLLKQQESNLRGTVKLLFQPAEEGGAGGKRMREEGVLENPHVQRIFGLHVWPLVETGSIASRAGTFLAAAGAVEITVTGKGGHAAMPHLAIDPVSTAAKIVTELQTIISRELDPLDSGVISITSIHGGEVFNVIPPDVRMLGTVRALTMSQLRHFQQRIRDVATHIAQAHQCEAAVEFPGHDYPPTVNDQHCWNVAQEIGSELLGKDNVTESPPIMGGEDFAYYTEAIEGCFVGLGIRNESIDAEYNVHHPKFKVDEDALPIGSALHVAFALRSLEELNASSN